MSNAALIFRTIALSLLFPILAFVAPPARAQDWTSYRIGEASVDVPSDWKATRKQRDRAISFESPGGDYQFEAYWWFPDEPLLGYDDIVSHKKIAVAGKPAMVIHSAFAANQTLLVAMDEARADKRQFLMRLDSSTADFHKGSPVLDEILARVAFGGKKAATPNPLAAIAAAFRRRLRAGRSRHLRPPDTQGHRKPEAGSFPVAHALPGSQISGVRDRFRL